MATKLKKSKLYSFKTKAAAVAIILISALVADVYKRQVYVPWAETSGGLKGIEEILWDGLLNSSELNDKEGNIPVSYTHLDVYKRQF